MDVGDINNIEECYKCGCAYFEWNQDEKIVRSQYLCKRCIAENKTQAESKDSVY